MVGEISVLLGTWTSVFSCQVSLGAGCWSKQLSVLQGFFFFLGSDLWSEQLEPSEFQMYCLWAGNPRAQTCRGLLLRFQQHSFRKPSFGLVFLFGGLFFFFDW